MPGDLLSSENADAAPSIDATWTDTAPEDWEAGNYRDELKEIYTAWLVFVVFLSAVPTLTGGCVIPIGIWLPWNDPDQKTLKLLMFILNFCPTSLVGPLKGRHPAAVRTLYDELLSATWEFVSLSIGPELYRRCGKMNATPFAYPYGGKPTDVFSKENVNAIMVEYAKVIKVVIKCCFKTMICSKGALACIKTAVSMEYLNENLSKLISASESRLEVSVHPERLLNKKFHGYRLNIECMLHDLIYTIARRLFYGDAADCIVAKQIHDKVEGSPAFKLQVEASRQSLVRARKVTADARLVVGTGGANFVDEAKLAARMDYKAQVLTAFQDHRKNEFDEKQLHLKLEQIHNELQANLIWSKRQKTLYPNRMRISSLLGM